MRIADLELKILLHTEKDFAIRNPQFARGQLASGRKPGYSCSSPGGTGGNVK